jgi:hypothetical protein
VAATAHGVRCSTAAAMSSTAMSSTASRPGRICSAREKGQHYYSEEDFKLCHGTLGRHRMSRQQLQKHVQINNARWMVEFPELAA